MNNQFFYNNIRFISEQDGIPERKLKNQLCELFSNFRFVNRAYLVRAHYGNPDEFNVVLCIHATTFPSLELENAIDKIFAKMFRTGEYLDMLYIDEEKENKLIDVCQPFFNRQGKD